MKPHHPLLPEPVRRQYDDAHDPADNGHVAQQRRAPRRHPGEEIIGPRGAAFRRGSRSGRRSARTLRRAAGGAVERLLVHLEAAVRAEGHFPFPVVYYGGSAGKVPLRGARDRMPA